MVRKRDVGPVFTVVDTDGKDVKAVPVSAVSRLTGMSRHTIKRGILDGDLNAIKAGDRLWLVPLATLDALLKRGWTAVTGRKMGRPWHKEKKR